MLTSVCLWFVSDEEQSSSGVDWCQFSACRGDSDVRIRATSKVGRKRKWVPILCNVYVTWVYYTCSVEYKHNTHTELQFLITSLDIICAIYM